MDLNLNHFRKLFLDMKTNTSLSELEVKLETMKGDIVDNAVEERDRALLIKLKSRKSLFLKKIDQALVKIENGTFGECEECEELIETNRLYARPTATCCLTCKEESERAESQMLYGKRSHTLGRSIINSDLSALSLLTDETYNKNKFNNNNIEMSKVI